MINIRRAREQDLVEIHSIFDWHIKNGFSTFSEPLSMVQRRQWFQQFQENSPYLCLVVEENQRILGFTCSSMFRGGGVFARTMETSIYLLPEAQGRGLGAQLYGQLFSSVTSELVHRVVVGIALPNEASIALHKKFGFTEVGVFDEYAYYKGAYRSSLWMQKRMNI